MVLTCRMATCVLLSVASLHSGLAPAQSQQLPEVIVSATRFEERYGDTPVNATVITAADIARSTARTVPELLAGQAGIAMRDLFGNNGASTTVDMRGFGAAAGQNTLILVDGRRMSDVDLSGVQWSSVPLDAIERIEILRGTGAVQYGDGAVAGVINIVTRHPGEAGNRATVAARAASHGTRELGLSASVRSGAAGFSATLRNLDSDGYRANNANRQSNLLATGAWTGESADLTVRFSGDRQGIRLPGARQVQPSAGVNLLETDRRGTVTPLDWAQRDGGQLSADLKVRVGAGELVLAAGHREKQQRSYFDFGGFPTYSAVDLDVTTFNPRLRMPFDALGARHSLVAGFDHARWSYRQRKSNSSANVGQPVNDVTATQEATAFYLLDTLRFSDRLAVTLGARRERLGITANDTYDPAAPGGAFGSGAPAGSQGEAGIATEAGMRYGVAPELALVAKAGRGFRFANVDEVYETSAFFAQQFQFLRPQRSHHYELGAEVGRGARWARVAVFRIDIDDEIHLDPFTTGVGNTNLPPSRRRGVELEGRIEPVRDLSLSAAYTYTDARFLEGVLPGGFFTQANVSIAGKTVPLVPRHKLDLRSSWAATDSTRVSGAVQFVDRRFMDNDEGNTLGTQVPSYAVADVKLVHTRGPLRLTAGINNLFDRRYYSYGVRSQFVADRYNAYPLPGRTFSVGLEYTLQ